MHTDSFRFLQDLKANNNRDWFHSQAKRYKAVRADYTSFVENLLVEMQKHDESLMALSPKHCTFRIARDIRFSKDKTPYKTHFGVGMTTHGKHSRMAEYYLHLEEGGAFVAGGIYMPDAAQLKKIRREIDVFYTDLQKIEQEPQFKKKYEFIDRNLTLVRPPKGFHEDHPAIEYLKLKSYTAMAKIDDEMLTSPQLLEEAVASFIILKPFIHFLNRGLMAEEEEW